MLKFLFRIFAKITAAIPTLLYFRYKKYYFKKHPRTRLKGGSILISNHISIMDYFTMLYLTFFKHMRCLVSEDLYRHKFVGWMSKMMGNILVHREISDMSFMAEAEKSLKKKKIINIFPEGHLSHDGKVHQFKPSVVYLALKTGAPIIPTYIDAHYNSIHRTNVIIGEPIYLKDYCDKTNPSVDEVKELCEMLRNKVIELGRKLTLYRKMQTYDVFSFKHKFLDVAKATCKLFQWIVWPTSYRYVGNASRKDRKIRGRGLIVSKHYSFYDPPILMMSYMSRRMRIVVAEELCKNNPKLFKWLWTIEYRRVSNSMDPKCFLECINHLKSDGVLAIYPEGHLTKDGLGEIHDGAAYFALMSNSPIYFYLMAKPWKPFHHNIVYIGETIYPDNIFTKEELKQKETIHKLTLMIQERMKNLYQESQKYIKQKKSK